MIFSHRLAIAMQDIGRLGRVSEISTRWAHLMHDGVVWRHRQGYNQHYPEYTDLLSTEVIGPPAMNDIFIREPDEGTLRDMREWLEEHARRKYKMFSRFSWVDNKLSVRRTFEGLLFKFSDPDMAFYFKMRWFCG